VVTTADNGPCVLAGVHLPTQRHAKTECPVSANATITVTYKGRAVVVELDGAELSDTSAPYLSNASRDFIGDAVETALLHLTREGRRP